LDFFCAGAKLNIELDGFQHGSPDQLLKDAKRDAWLEARGIKVLRFWNGRLRTEKDVVRDTIWRVLQERAPQPVPEYCMPMKPSEKPRGVKFSSALPPHPALSLGERVNCIALSNACALLDSIQRKEFASPSIDS
jgi:hypothetical protein